MKIDQNTASTIVRNVLGAANQRVQIEADLHAVPVKEIKALLRDAGIDLRSLKGEKKSSGWRHGGTATRKRAATRKPEILPEPPEEPEELEEKAKKVYEEFGIPAFLTESEQKADYDRETARTISSEIEETAAEKQQDEPLPEGTDLEGTASGGLYRVENIAAGELLGQPCAVPSTCLLYGAPPQKIAGLEEIFDGLRKKVEKLRDQRKELAEQLRKTDDLLAYITMRCDIITEAASAGEEAVTNAAEVQDP